MPWLDHFYETQMQTLACVLYDEFISATAQSSPDQHRAAALSRFREGSSILQQVIAAIKKELKC